MFVVTIFGGPERAPFSFPATILHKEWGLEFPVAHRRNEDEVACRVVGCGRVVLDFPDAIYRQDDEGHHLYPTFEALREAPAAADAHLVMAIASAIEELVREETAVLYCPLGLGAHVDHVLTRQAGRLLANRHRVVSYRDFVYDRTWDGQLDEKSGTPIYVNLTDQERAAKRRGVAAYRSQVSDLFGTETLMIEYFETIGRQELLLMPNPNGSVDDTALRSLLEKTCASPEVTMSAASVETFPSPAPYRDFQVALRFTEFTNLSRVTGLPEFGEIHITYTPGASCIERKSLKYYLTEFRDAALERDDVPRRILDALVHAIQPRRMTVTAIFTTSGDREAISVNFPPST